MDRGITFKAYAEKLLTDYRHWLTKDHTPSQLLHTKQQTMQLLAQANQESTKESVLGFTNYTHNPG